LLKKSYPQPCNNSLQFSAARPVNNNFLKASLLIPFELHQSIMFDNSFLLYEFTVVEITSFEANPLFIILSMFSLQISNVLFPRIPSCAVFVIPSKLICKKTLSFFNKDNDYYYGETL